MKRKILIGAIALLLIIGSDSALAHTALVASNPSAGVTIKKLPNQIILRFAESLLNLGSAVVNRVSVLDPKGVLISASRSQTRGSTLINTLNVRWKRPGNYRVSYRISAQDGHVVSSSFIFTLKN